MGNFCSFALNLIELNNYIGIYSINSKDNLIQLDCLEFNVNKHMKLNWIISIVWNWRD
ncbi:hypothetical protein [Metamycoplasma auris]|uniref:hypothetical protein n=1 Tax=Metamycoplasma auris TaxID=51363 RepID=UPI0014746C7F|nr:hypothetical protein [Metamycoplasma auris]